MASLLPPSQPPQPPIILDEPWTGDSYTPPLGLDITTIERAIVNQLQSFLSQALGGQMIEIRHFPDKPEAYRMTHRIGVALVIYMGSDFADIIDTMHVAQERTLEFAVGLRIRDLGWAFGGPPSGPSPGAYQIIELVRMALLGFQPNPGCTPFKAAREAFLDRDKEGGVWVYESRFTTRTVVVENYAPPTFPLFIHGTAQEEGLQTTIQVQIGLYTFGSPIYPVNTINLGQQNLSAVTVKSADLRTAYAPGIDYNVDTVNGIITWLSTGSISPNATVAISYGYSDVVTALASGGAAPFAPHN